MPIGGLADSVDELVRSSVLSDEPTDAGREHRRSGTDSIEPDDSDESHLRESTEETSHIAFRPLRTRIGTEDDDIGSGAGA